MIERSDTITVIIPAICDGCGCEVYPENVGFECDTFVVCQKCYDKEENDYHKFLDEMHLEEV